MHFSYKQTWGVVMIHCGKLFGEEKITFAGFVLCGSV
jgi:hypothetical protein